MKTIPTSPSGIVQRGAVLALVVAPESGTARTRASLNVQFDSADGGAPVMARVQLIVE